MHTTRGRSPRVVYIRKHRGYSPVYMIKPICMGIARLAQCTRNILCYVSNIPVRLGILLIYLPAPEPASSVDEDPA